MSQQQNSLEQYVANRYVNELTQNGYQPVCQDAVELIEDAHKVMATLNLASQRIKTALQQKRDDGQQATA